MALGLLLCIASPAFASAPLRLASLEWLPYVGASLEQEGWASFVAGTAARQLGQRVKIEYFPWTRAMQLGAKDPQYAGYFPAYYTEERARTCHFSAPIGSSTVGLAYLKNAPLQWSDMQDLAALKIGVVAGFSNGPAFDAMVREGKLTVDASPNDMLNLRKLLARRIDAVVIDKLVMRFLLATEPGLMRDRNQFAFHDKPLAELPLHICFQRTPAGRELQQAFDQAVQSLPLRKLEADYFQRLERRQ
ncbi:MAG TPA: transporter substrate-binding domain-containing protein [Noviherbaspirillum sp.]|nr:transporter substrate-binding domain-containing protein [Noviherbaspirillum sp.]